MRLMVLLNEGPTALIALETAIRLAERGDTGVQAVVVGGGDRDALLRRAIAAGCEHAVRFDLGGAAVEDVVANAAAAAEIARRFEPNLILIGGREGRTGMNLLGPAIAEFLGVCHVGSVSSVRVSNACATVERRAEGVLDTIECPLPAVVSVEWGPRLRYPTLQDRLRSRNAAIELWDESDVDAIPVLTRVIKRTGPKPHRKLATRSLPALDHVMGLLLGGVGGGGSGRRLEGGSEEVAAQIVAACLPEMEGL